MMKILEKIERRIGEKLFLKGARCNGPKCAAVRRNYPPGMKRKKGGNRGLSEYGQLFREKQKIRYWYGLDDRTVEGYSKVAASHRGAFSANFVDLVERRLDNAVFRLGFTEGRRIARQAVGHGHITVNGKSVTIPSYQLKKGDVVGIKTKSLASGHFANLELRLKRYEAPRWFSLDREKKEGKLIARPEVLEGEIGANFTAVKEFYAR